MGIQGLLPLLKSIQKPTRLLNFAGQTLGVDAYGWLHRGAIACAIELAQQKPTRKHIDFCLHRVRMLLHFGVKPYVVFDGAYLPSKAHTERERAARRQESRRLGLELLAMGRVSQAYAELQKAVDVTPAMARELIEELKILGVPYVVAPYEADSQLAYLEKTGAIDGVISEDSDLLVFGVKRLLTKLDPYGELVMIDRKDFTACREVSLVGWTDREFRMMAMLSGCDYLPGLEKLGLKTAYRLVRQHKSVEKVVRAVQFGGKTKVPANYLEDFTKAERTFLYQWVYCEEAKGLVNLNKLPSDIEAESMPYIGTAGEPELAADVAAGELDPNTKERLVFNHRRDHHPGARMAAVQTPSEKPGKPITEFFKAKRTPLAELDPNSFTPSPSQRRLLEDQAGGSWSATQAPRTGPGSLARAHTTNGPSSAPQASRRVVSERLSDTHHASPKRQRLCSESVLASSMDGTVGMQSATSRFFSKQGTQQSPTLRKTCASRKKKDDFELYTDDSVTEAASMVAGPITEAAAVMGTPSPKKRKKLKVFAEDTEGDTQGIETGTLDEHSQSPVASKESNSQDSSRPDIDTPATSFEASQISTSPSLLDSSVDANFAALKSKFGFKSDTTPASKKAPRTTSAPMRSRGLLDGCGAPTTTGLKRTEATSITRIKATPSKPVSRKSVASASPAQDSPLALGAPSNDADVFSDAELLAFEQQDVSPEVARNGGSAAVQGSEDLLVPNSPEVGDGKGERGKLKSKLNLGRFAFGS